MQTKYGVFVNTAGKILIRYTHYEVACWAHAGTTRHCNVLTREDKSTFEIRHENAWSNDIEAVAAEAAVAKWLGVYYEPSDKGGTDVAGFYEVRSTRVLHGWMGLHEWDKPDDQPYILVTGRMPLLTIHGWITGKEGMHQRYWTTKGLTYPCFVIRQSDLHPLANLPPIPESLTCQTPV